MSFGYTGRIPGIDVSTSLVSAAEDDERFCRRYLGSTGLVAHTLVQEVPRRIDAFDPENRLVFALGPVSGAQRAAQAAAA
jgi:aldehyde:ferredoxin oxidoreductase